MNQINVLFLNKENKYITIYKTIKKLIINGTIHGGEKLPSRRDLSLHLNVSSNTILNAYNMLLDEGYIYSKEKSGYFVSSDRYIIPENKYSFEEETEEKEKEYQYDFTSENIDSSLFPFYTFKKVSIDIMSNNPNIWLKRNNYQGDVNLRNSIAKYLLENKGMEVTKDNIIIVSSLEDSLSIVNSLINIKIVALENPVFPKVNNFFKGIAKTEYLPLDEEGITIPDKKIHYDLVYVTPYNQYPTGVKMTTSRKHELINNVSGFIFEDDFDCDLISQNKIMSTLYSLNSAKVIYHGSFSHTLCPGLRLSYLVLPPSLIKKYHDKYKNTSGKISSLDQNILYRFLDDGYYYRHITRLKSSLNDKKKIIKRILEENKISYEEKELSFFINYKKSDTLEEIKNNSIKINNLNQYLIGKKDMKLILCYTNIKKEDLIPGLSLLLKIIK